jgi:hypothetical protein
MQTLGELFFSSWVNFLMTLGEMFKYSRSIHRCKGLSLYFQNLHVYDIFRWNTSFQPFIRSMREFIFVSMATPSFVNDGQY